MKKANRNRLFAPLVGALLIGIMSGSVVELMNAYETTEWAVEGKPFVDRWLNRQGWFLAGFVPGALIGAVGGCVWLLYKSNKEHDSNF